jgi:hypothetical protein
MSLQLFLLWDTLEKTNYVWCGFSFFLNWVVDYACVRIQKWWTCVSLISLVSSSLSLLCLYTNYRNHEQRFCCSFRVLSAQDTQQLLFCFCSNDNNEKSMSLRLCPAFLKRSWLYSALACFYTESIQHLWCLSFLPVQNTQKRLLCLYSTNSADISCLCFSNISLPYKNILTVGPCLLFSLLTRLSNSHSASIKPSSDRLHVSLSIPSIPQMQFTAQPI